MSAPNARDWFLLAILGLIWGSSFLAVSVALRDLDPLAVSTGRIVIGATILCVVAVATGQGLPSTSTKTGRRIWLHCLGFALFTNALPFTFLSWAQQHVSSGFAGITMAAVPLFVVPLAWLFLNENMTVRRLMGFLIGFIGVIVLIGPAAIGGLGSTTENIARLICLVASLCYALGTMVTRTAPKVPLLSYSAGGLLIASIIIVPIFLLIEGIPQTPGTDSAISLIFLGVFPTAVATILLVTIINSAGPTFLSLVNYQVPIWAVVMGLIFLHEALPPTFIAALLLILAGLALSQARSIRFRP